MLAGADRGQFSKIPKSTYHGDRTAVSKSVLDEVDLSPAHARAYLDGLRPWRYSRALDVGDVAHAMILEPDNVARNYMSPPRKLDRRRAPDKHLWADLEIEAAASGKTLLTFDDFTTAIAIRDAIFRHKKAASIFGKGEPEATFVWRDPKTGEHCKCRVDWLRSYFLTDLKTTRDASPKAFARDVINYRYDVQDAHYTDGVDPSIGFVFVVVEKIPPFGVAIYADQSRMRRLGAVKRDRDLATFAECKASGIWPGYPEEIQVIDLPPYAYKELENAE